MEGVLRTADAFAARVTVRRQTEGGNEMKTIARGMTRARALRRDPPRAVREDGVACLICGRFFKQLTNTHLRFHGLSTSEYNRQLGYNLGRPLMGVAVRHLYR